MGVWLAGAALNDGQWHSVDLNFRRGRLSLTVDKEEGGSAHASPSFPVAIESHLFFGGKSRTGRLYPFLAIKPCQASQLLSSQL